VSKHQFENNNLEVELSTPTLIKEQERSDILSAIEQPSFKIWKIGTIKGPAYKGGDLLSVKYNC